MTADAIRLKIHFIWKPCSDVCSHTHTHVHLQHTAREGYTIVVGCLSIYEIVMTNLNNTKIVIYIEHTKYVCT